MTKFGYGISAEQVKPYVAVNIARMADEMNFEYIMISDHFHPWIEAQGQSAFVWSVIGGMAQVTKKLKIGTGVTCPIIRTHPVIIAQAAATSNVMLEGRFILGIGTGENLNEHVVGLGWPPYEVRKLMMIEAIKIIRLLWQGKYTDYFGEYFTVDKAKIYTRTETPPELIISAYGPKSAEVAGEMGDGLVCTSPDKSVVEVFEKAGGAGNPKYIQLHASFNTNLETAKEIALNQWPTSGMPSPLSSELRLPSEFGKAAKKVKVEDLEESIIMGDDPAKYLEQIQKAKEAGYDHIYFNQIGENQEEFMRFLVEKVVPQAT
jgi:coenzyme F420-dependent glucose-6-phosphate dehydrogenase